MRIRAAASDDAELLEVEQTAIPGPGACGGMYTANTMASAIEALGMSLANSSAQEAVSEQKKEDCRRASAAVMNLIEADIKPLDIMTKQAFENAITVVIALGGSTNAVLHLIAMAAEAWESMLAWTTSPGSARACRCLPMCGPAANT